MSKISVRKQRTTWWSCFVTYVQSTNRNNYAERNRVRMRSSRKICKSFLCYLNTRVFCHQNRWLDRVFKEAIQWFIYFAKKHKGIGLNDWKTVRRFSFPRVYRWHKYTSLIQPIVEYSCRFDRIEMFFFPFAWKFAEGQQTDRHPSRINPFIDLIDGVRE